jgi:hypothetical protein
MAAADPTAGFAGTGVGQQYSALTPQQLQQWQGYFTGAGQGSNPANQATTTNQLVQTGSAFSPTIPWLTGQGAPGGAAASGLSALGITPSSNPLTLSNNIEASPLAGANPSNPYYSLILNQMGQGTTTPTYTNEAVTTPGSPYATVNAQGYLTGNLTPEEQALTQYFGLSPSQSENLPMSIANVVNTGMYGGTPGQQQQMATGNWMTGPTG